jgi:hypothetical protein
MIWLIWRQAKKTSHVTVPLMIDIGTPPPPTPSYACMYFLRFKMIKDDPRATLDGFTLYNSTVNILRSKG